ncbi:hypothetical protein I8J29_21565 [Paenibacillus sp. MWE-103]|uniref:YjzC-like protein n=1 Tax=Paenibacillus artemisiicola TaxID=1172618 RepID=A0ABS3WEU0_9BACL|nr:hypothetical protein [Paenibacillus artemisiicola]MBO7746808.1 hypothetical protein [Paenibacillus artemisiicola]
MNHPQPQPPQDGKKAWTTPSLIVLSVKETKASGDKWQFVQDGDFWKRTPLIS